MENIKYHVALNYFPKFGPQRLRKINKYFSNLEDAFKASSIEFMKAGIEEKIINEFIDFRKKINPDKIIEDLDKKNIKIITINNKSYPKLLSEIYNPPQILYYKGNIEVNKDITLAVVGTRKYTNYGKQVINNIISDLAKNKITIISGLALGIDTLAHLQTIESGGKTIAILGSGLDNENLYPASNKYLVDKIILTGGAVISEFPPGTPPLKHHFPQRNRIISGMSLGTLVVEAPEKSGALITSSMALEQNREVFAVPGNIYSPMSKGPNKLIQMGAKSITKSEDVLEALNITDISIYNQNHKNNNQIKPDSKEEEIILSFLSREPTHIDNIIRLSNLDTQTINSTLTIMEMKGIVKNLGGMQYIII